MWSGNIVINLINGRKIYIKKEEIIKFNKILFFRKDLSELIGEIL